MSQKLALIIGNSEYTDTNLARLVTPSADVNNLAEVLRIPDIGAFDEVTTLINEMSATIRRAIARFFAQKNPDDLLLLYFSGHGVLDDQGQLFLATKDTERDLLSGTAIPATFITGEMDRSRSRRQVLILDCCHSGAFARGSKGATGASVGTASMFEGTGYGRVVLTASDATQYAWEGDQVIGQAENSVFTHYMIEGLRTGAADTDGDGNITLDELYNYAYAQVVNKTPKQTPGKWSYKQQGEILIAKNPKPVLKPIELPRELREAVEDSRPWVREGAVHELEHLLNGSNPGLALAADEALKQLKEDDSRRVATVADQVLAAYESQVKAKSEQQERARLAREQTEAERLAREKTKQERLARERQARELKAREEDARVTAQKAWEENRAHEKAEQERLTREKVERDRIAKEPERILPRESEASRPSVSYSKLPAIAAIVGVVCIVLAFAFGVFRFFTTPAFIPAPTRVVASAPTSAPTVVPQNAALPTPTPTSTPTSAPTVVPQSAALPTPTRAPKLSPIDGALMVFVPAGEFLMGSNDGDSAEKPPHLVYLDAFWIDKYEVTNALYKKCVDAGKCSRPRETKSQTHGSYYGNTSFDNYPAIYVSWDDANAFCGWAGKKLPTEAQWEKAAGWDDAKKEKRVYPWGNSIDKNLLNSAEGARGDTTPVGGYTNGASPYGVIDMAGNVWEWVADWYDSNYYKNSPVRNPKNEIVGQQRVVRGGSWLGSMIRARAADRGRSDQTSRFSDLGFRCVE